MRFFRFIEGKWYQKSNGEWHAHLCVPQQAYLDQAKTAIKAENIRSTSREWNGATDIETGISGWYTRKRIEFTKYKNECIQSGIPLESLMDTDRLSQFNSLPEKFELVWTSPAPRIGIIARSSTSITLAELYDFMSQVHLIMENELSKRDKRMANFGCHLCVYVCAQSGTSVTRKQGQVLSDDGQLSINDNMVGHIQIDELQYLLWLPHRSKQVWLSEFRQTEHFVET